ncbi:hypothetical protein EHM76_04585 [bacterium]|nr:MAG: hypothetical protein EHM76_04585 [bacterium]
MAGGYVNVRSTYCEDCAVYLRGAFTWPTSPEGQNFWEAVHNRIKEVGKGSRPTEPLFANLVGDQNNKEIKRLNDLLEIRNAEIATLSARVVTLNNKLMVSDWVNHSLPRGGKS